jgi:hypothetical protein
MNLKYLMNLMCLKLPDVPDEPEMNLKFHYEPEVPDEPDVPELPEVPDAT